MTTKEEYKKLLDKVEKITKEKKLDLSSDEDLSIGIMNLISIEEHLFFTAQKTNKDAYYKILKEVREMRKELLKKIVKDYEGEVWCISKHLLSASMRLIEVGTKELGKGKEKEAKELFDKAFNLYSLFWALNLKVVDSKMLKEKDIISPGVIKKIQDEEKNNSNAQNLLGIPETKNKGFFAKISDAIKKAIDCCKE